MNFIEVESDNGSVKYWLNPLEIKSITKWGDRRISLIFKDGSTMAFHEDSQSAQNIMDAIGATKIKRATKLITIPEGEITLELYSDRSEALRKLEPEIMNILSDSIELSKSIGSHYYLCSSPTSTDDLIPVFLFFATDKASYSTAIDVLSDFMNIAFGFSGREVNHAR